MKYQLVDHDDGDKKYVLDWQESTPPDDEAIQGILAENRQQPKPQAAPQAPTAPKSTELPPGAISFDPNAKFQPEAVEHVAAKDKATADLLGAGVPFGEKPLEQQITEEYKTPTLEVPRQVANQYRVKGTTPGSIEWFNKLPDEHKDAVKPYMSAKDQAKVEGMEQDGAEAFMQSSANAESFGMLNKQGAALAEVRHPNIAAAGQLAGTLVDFMPEGSAVHLAAQLPRIAARAKSYGRVGGVIANAVTAGTTMGLDAMIRNKDDLSSPIPEVADKAQKNILNQIEYGVLAVAPSMAKVAGWSHRVAQGALYMLMSAKDDPEAFKKENIGQTFGAAVTMAILGGKGHEARAREAPKLDEATGQPIQDKTIIPEEEFDLSRFAPKPEGKEVPDAEKEKRQEGETHAEAGITTPEIPISGQEKKDVQGSQAQAAPVLTPEQRVQLDELRKQNAPPPPVDPDKPEPHPDQGTWDKNNSAIDFFRNNGYIYDEEKKRYVPENIPGDAEKYWASFGRLGPEYTRPDVDDKETRAKSRSLGREAGQSEEALTKSGRQAPLPGSEAGGVAPVEGQGRSGEPVGASQPEVRRVPRKPQTWTGNPEVDREAWSANLKSKLREEILNQPGGKQQWDYVMGKKTRDKNNNPIHYTNLTSKLLHDTYDYYETTEGRQDALKILGKSENPFSDFEDVASVAQGAKHPFEVHRMMQAERKNPTTPGEKKMTDAEAQEYERYMRAQDEAVGAHRVDLGGGDVAFAKAEKGQTEKKAIEHFGLTDNPREAGYLLEDGKMLDFSGRHEAAGYENKKPKKGEPDYLANERVVDHRQVQEIMKSGGWQAVEDFTKDSGAIRFMVVGGDEINLSIQDFQNPTETQWAKIARTQRELGGNTITYDIINEGGYTVEGGNAKSVLEIKTALKKAKAAAAGEGGQTSLFAKQDRTGFFSNAEAAVDKINMPKAPAEQWLKMLDPAKGVGTKADEMKWIGLDDFLKEKGNQSVAKQEIQDFIDQNKVKLEEVKKGKEPFKSPLTEEESDRMEELGLMENHTSEEADEYNKLSKKFKLEKDKWLEAGEGTKFASYQIPGGSNYRELLMTLPTIDKKLSPAEMKELEKLNFTTRRTPEDEKRLDELIAKGTNNRPDLGYKSPHWDEPNVLAHVRLNDRTDAEGKKVLFIEEIQSDWHQEGRKKGYIGELPKGWKVEEFTPELGDNKYQVLDEQGQQMGSGKTKEEAIRISNRQGQVPAAPFSKTWHELVFKRALRDAVEGGYDKFAWTTGEQQAARYDLTKHIGKAIWNEDTKMLTAYDPSMEKTVLQVDIKSPQELENYIGKDAAQKLIDAKPDTEMDRTISGLDLKVGGEGMKGFYDKILVDYANKYGKKWGSSVSSARINAPDFENTPNVVIISTNKATDFQGSFPLIEKSDSGINIKLESGMDKPISVEGSTGTSNTLGDFANWHSRSEKIFSKLPVPIRVAVLDRVRLMLHDDKIGKSIVSLVPVDVVDNLTGKQVSSEMLLHDPSMLSDYLVPDANGKIPVPVMKTMSAIVRDPAFPVTEIVFGSTDAALWPDNLRSTKSTKSFHGSSPEEVVESLMNIIKSAKVGKGDIVHSMDITPAMRESVMREGQPMFAKGSKAEPRYTAKTLQPILNCIAPKGLLVAVDNEASFPQNVRADIKVHGFEGQIIAVYDGLTGKLFINAEHMGSEAEIRKYVKHELTHLGLRISLGKKIEPIYKTLYGKYKNSETGKAIVSNYFPDGFHPEEYWNHKITFVDEVLAKLGETNVDPGFLRRMVARIKVMLNSRFPGMKFTDKDVRAMIANAHRDAEKFGKKLEDLPEGHQLQYDADTKKWAVLNAKGETVNEDADRTKAIAFAKGEDHNGEGAGIAKKLGVRFDGIQEGAGKVPERYAFTDAKTGSSFVGKDEEEARKRFEDMKTRFAAPEVAFALKGKDPEEVLDNIPKTPPRSLPSKPMAGIFGALKALHTKVTSIEGVYSPFKKTLLEWDSKNQQLAQKATNAVNYVKKFVPDKARRDAISVYREAGGDKAVLRKWAQETPQGKLQGKYVLALNLTDQEKKVADGITELYQKLLERGQKYGLIDQARMNYVTHLVQRGDAVGKEAMKGLSSGKLVSAFKFGRESDFPTIHDAEQALGTNDFGQTFRYKVATSDAADLMGIYISEMEKTINTKDLIKNLTEQKAKDGRPLAVPAGAVKSSVNGETGDKTLVVKPREVDKDYSDYRGVDHYALNDWKWIGKDTGGNPVTIKGDLVLHPDIVKHVKNVLGSSGIRDWYNNPPNVFQAIPAKILKTVDNWQNNTKQAMFSVSAFHWVQEGTHAIGHRVNPFKVPTIDLEGNKDHIDAADHGLKLKGDYDGMAAFREGLGVGPLMYKIPGIGKLLEKSSEPLFTWYIPGLKYKTYEHILGRNMTRFEKEIQAGKVTADDVKYVSAKQANAAYGHLNYVDMGRNPTIQHLFRMFTLAPDFLEARTRFAAQAVGGTISKGGREQLEALAVLAVTQYVACRIINKLADDDYHMDQPFKVVIGTKTYGLRSVPGDLYHLYQNHNQFVQGRISPVLGKSVEHLLTGRDYRGLPQSDLSFLKEVATSALPISLRAAIPGMSTNKDVNAYDSFLSATGIGVSRYSPLTCMYDMVDKWKASQGITKQEAVYPPAKFRDLRNAVQDGEEGGVYKHWDELLKGGKIHTTALKEHFRQSLFRPFTGSEKTEKAFRRSLSPEDRKIYDVAVMDKQRTWKNFLKIMGERPVQDKGQEKTVQSDTTQAQEGETHEP